MNVDSLSLYNFTSHTETRIKFPRTGIVLVTGENGAGKSSIIDGVSWAGWGKTIRGDVPWRGNGVPTCTATMRADDVAVSRSRAASKNEMEWPPLSACREYRAKAYDVVRRVIDTHPGLADRTSPSILRLPPAMRADQRQSGNFRKATSRSGS